MVIFILILVLKNLIKGEATPFALKVTDLEDELHVGQQADALVGGQRQQPVVIHDTVHGLDPGWGARHWLRSEGTEEKDWAHNERQG